MTILRSIAVSIAFVLVAGCGSPPPAKQTPAQAVQAREMRAVDALHLRNRYKDIITGWDVKGTTLVLYANRDAMLSMDEPAEAAMMDDLIARWAKIWRSNHRGNHAKLKLDVRDFYGEAINSGTTQ